MNKKWTTKQPYEDKKKPTEDDDWGNKNEKEQKR